MAATNTDNRDAVFPSFVWGFIAFCFFGLLAIVAVRYFGNFNDYDSQRAADRAAKLAEYREAMGADLGSLKWADKEKQTVQVPIDVAMEIAMRKLAAKKVAASSVPVVAPVVPAPDAAAPAASPAAAAPAAPQPTTPE